MNKLKKTLALLLSLVMILSLLPAVAFADGEEQPAQLPQEELEVSELQEEEAQAVGENVAKIGDTGYATLAEAFAAAQDGDTITLLKDCTGNGIKAPQDKFNNNGLTVDFDNHTYTVNGGLVGSTGTETQAFQLLMGNKITFQNGTITSTVAKFLVQNYSDLTLEGMTLTLDNPNYKYAYTLSNNNGNVVIDDTTINANPAGGFAFDVCRYASYPSVNVTVTGDSVINGDVEVSASNNNAMNGFSLTLESGTLNGSVVEDPSATAAMAATPTKAAITKEDGFVQNVAKIGTTGYTTLQAAITAAQADETIEILSDIALDKVLLLGKSVNIDGNKHTLTNTASRVIRITEQNLVVSLTDWDLVSTCTAASDVRCISFDDTSRGSTLSLDGCNLSASFYTINAIVGADNLTINIKNGTVAAGWAALNLYSNNSKIYIDNSTLSGLNDKGESSWNNFNTITIDGNSLWNAGNVGQYGSNNELTITRSTIYAESENDNNQYWIGIQYGATGNKVTVDRESQLINTKNEDQTGNFLLGWYCDYKNGNFSYRYDSENVIEVDTSDGLLIMAGAGAAITVPSEVDGGYYDLVYEQDWTAGEYTLGDHDKNVYVFLVPKALVPFVAAIGSAEYTTLEAAVADAVNDGTAITITGETTFAGIELAENDTITVVDVASPDNTNTTVKEVAISSNDTITTAYVLSDGENTNAISSEKVAVDNSITNQNVKASDLVQVANVIAKAVSEADDVSVNTLTDVIISLAKEQPTYEQLQGVEVPEGAVAFEVHPVATVKVIQEDEVVEESSYNVQNDDLATGASFTFSLDLGTDFANKTVALTHYGTDETEFLGIFTADESGIVSGITLSSFSVVTAQEAVASITKDDVTTYFATLAEAFAAAVDGDTIILQKDCSGSGIIVPQGEFNTTGLTVDFNGHTYTVNSDPLAGSNGTKTQAFQLLKDNTITFKNGSIVADNANVKMIIQNYSNLTLDDMTLDATKGTNSVGYVLSTNNGSTTINDTTITAKDNGIAFDACSGWGGYVSNAVAVTGTSVINGNVEVSYYGQTGTDPAELTLTSGTLNGSIIMGEGSYAAYSNVQKDGNQFSASAPDGYEWALIAGESGYRLVPKTEATFLGGSLRRRVSTTTNQVVNTSTDIRFGFNFRLSEGYTLDTNKSYFTWRTNSMSQAVKVQLENYTYDEATGLYTANLVITGVPANFFGTTIYADLYVEATKGTDIKTAFAAGERTVRQVIDGIIEDPAEPTTWKNYAKFLLNQAQDEY